MRGSKGRSIMLGMLLIAAACTDSADQLGPRDTAVPAAGDDTPESPNPTAQAPDPANIPVRVDQFGYRPADPKMAVIADPQMGSDAGLSFEPGASYEVRRWSDDEVVFEGEPEPWSDGAVHSQSGDRGWWFDFSSVDERGSYYIVDAENDVATGRFEISDEVYDEVLGAALRAFWFNRANTPHPESLAGPWSDGAAYVGPGQDTEARSIDDPGNASTALDLSGGWFDAGDVNKYVTFAGEPVHQLLAAYRQNPAVFDDAVGIPESGNGVPDLLDEVWWELEWLARMQRADGGLLTKVGVTEWGSSGVPSEATQPRFYEEACSSATIAGAAMFAHAAVVFDGIPALADKAAGLRERAVSAWDWYQNNEKRDDCDPQIVKAGDADLSLEEQQNQEIIAAVYLHALTGDDPYRAVVSEGYARTHPFVDGGLGRYYPEQADALLYHRDHASLDTSIVDAIDDRLTVRSRESAAFDPDADLYRAFMPDEQYHWGSNQVKANIGTTSVTIDGAPSGVDRALDYLHYFHGVNPLATVYLSNMGGYGAERSVQYLFHYWFGDDTAFDLDNGSDVGVAPGYVVGGPNRSYSGSDAPPADQPPMKSYRDAGWQGSEPVWETTEPAIYYQAAYIRLLSAVMGSS